MRPDQDPRLVSIGMGNTTCEKCMMELYTDVDDSVCEDCNLNPMKKGDATQFIKEAAEQEDSFSTSELLQRYNKMNKKT